MSIAIFLIFWEKDASIVLGLYKHGDNEPIVEIPSNIKGVLDGVDTIKAHMEVGTSFYFNAVWGCLYTRKIVGEARFDENLTDSEDAVFFFEVAFKEPRMIIDKNFCSYIYHPKK